jgi:hypothetical protein
LASMRSGNDDTKSGSSASVGEQTGAKWLDAWITDEPDQMSANEHQEPNPDHNQTDPYREEANSHHDHADLDREETNAYQDHADPYREETNLDHDQTDREVTNLIDEHDQYHQETDPDHEEMEPEPTEQPEEFKSRDDELFNAQQQKLFNDILDKQFDKLGKQAEKYGVRSYRWYMDNALEQEAYPAGLLAFLMAQAKNQSGK